MKILVTGGAGYIGSHTCLELLNNGYEVAVVDSLVGSKREALRRVETLTGKALSLYEVDLLDRTALEQVFQAEAFDAVIHFAALKAPGESVSQPLRYYHNNLTGTLHLLEVMGAFGVKSLVFSSSAAVYGNDVGVPVVEEAVCGPINPYARSKWMLEMILRDLYVADPSWDILLLRYFNPVGAHQSGHIGEDPRGMPNNLMPIISRVAVGRLPELLVYGNDYPTPDGTGIRDYIHVVDLASGHLRALERLQHRPGLAVYNLGNNRGYSVLELVEAFERASGRKIPYRIVDRRPGDIAISFADASKANRELGWKGKRSLDEMCVDVWRWQSSNPDGYPD
jgi:UDP-glucose 4-epimerase